MGESSWGPSGVFHTETTATFVGHFRGHLHVHSRVHFREHFFERVHGSHFAVRILCACLNLGALRFRLDLITCLQVAGHKVHRIAIPSSNLVRLSLACPRLVFTVTTLTCRAKAGCNTETDLFFRLSCKGFFAKGFLTQSVGKPKPSDLELRNGGVSRRAFFRHDWLARFLCSKEICCLAKNSTIAGAPPLQTSHLIPLSGKDCYQNSSLRNFRVILEQVCAPKIYGLNHRE